TALGTARAGASRLRSGFQRSSVGPLFECQTRAAAHARAPRFLGGVVPRCQERHEHRKSEQLGHGGGRRDQRRCACEDGTWRGLNRPPLRWGGDDLWLRGGGATPLRQKSGISPTISERSNHGSVWLAME